MKRQLLKLTLPAAIAAFLLATTAARAQDAAPKPAQPSQARFGVNLAGAEFGGQELPGIHGRHYTYPEARLLDYYQKKGRTLIRLPFHWERMQHALNGPLDADEMARLKGVLRAAGERGMQVIIDVHNYGRYRAAGEAQSQIIGTERVPYAAFADLWSRLATALKDEPGLFGYGLMNEPHDMGDDTRWPRAAQAAVDAIRRVDSKTAIVVAGDNWSGARGWRDGVNKDLNEKVRDPRNNLIFEAHCYFDGDNSGSYKKSYAEEKATPNLGVERVRPFVEWCRDKGVRGFVGEYGVPDTDARWLVVMDRFLAYLQENNISSTYWAGGPWWGQYPLSIEPADARDAAAPDDGAEAKADRPQMLVLRQYPG